MRLLLGQLVENAAGEPGVLPGVMRALLEHLRQFLVFFVGIHIYYNDLVVYKLFHLVLAAIDERLDRAFRHLHDLGHLLDRLVLNVIEGDGHTLIVVQCL